MAQTAGNVRVGITGAVYVAPKGTTLPTTAVAALDAAFKELGFVSDDGVTESFDEDSSNITAWQGATVVRRVTTSSEAKLALTMIETKKSTLELYHKNSVVASDGGTGFKIDVKSPGVDHRCFVIDVVDGTDIIRFVVPDGEVTERGEVTYASSGDEIGYPVTITAYPDTANTVYTKLSNSAAWGTP